MTAKRGFTLAEILVTLGIIGIVAALTFPTLANNWQRKSYVTQLHKVYNEFQQGFVQLMDEHQAQNVVEAGLYTGSSYEKNFITHYFDVTQDCGTTSGSCFASRYKTINGGSGTITTSGYHALLSNGAVIAFNIDGINKGDENTEDFVGTIFVDVNGQEGPNVGGRDMFKLYFYADGTVDDAGVNPNCRKNGGTCYGGGTPRSKRDSNFNSCKTSLVGEGCFGKIINDNWVMNY